MEMDILLPPPNNMKISTKENQRKRKRINNSTPVFSTGEKVIFLAEDQQRKMLNKPPFKFSKKDEETLQAVLYELSISSTPINFKKIS